MSHLAENIMSVAQVMPEGSMIVAKDFLHLGSSASINKTLSRLTQEGKLLRVSRGAYVRPHEGRFGMRPPSTESVLQGIEASSGETVVAHGAAEANALGLTTQVPIREVFFTSGPSRTLHLGSRCVELKHGSRWQLLLGTRPAGQVIRALSWLGPEAAPAALEQLHSRLPEAEWKAVCGARDALPSWLAQLISIGVCRLSDEAEKRTREGLADVDAGRVVDQQMVEAWAASLSSDVPLSVPGLNQGGE
ncbi:DUF6088 family protein [Ectopseudomonas oleovorans]